MSALIEAVVRLVKERADLTRLFNWNACMKHGVPYDAGSPDVNVTVKHQHEHSGVLATTEDTKPPAEPTASPPVAPPPTPPEASIKAEKGVWARIWPWLLAAAVGGTGATGAYNMLKPTPTQEPPPAPQQPAVEYEREREGSLLQYLEDGGHHLKGGIGDGEEKVGD